MCRTTYKAAKNEKSRIFFYVALDSLKRHSGIVWDPGRFRGIAPRRGRKEVGEPCGRTRPNPHALAKPGATQLMSANCKIPLSRSPFGRCVASYAAEPLGNLYFDFLLATGHNPPVQKKSNQN